MPPGAASLNSNMIRDGHSACRLKPASPAVPAASAKEENKKNNDDKRRAIHDVQPSQCDGFSLGFSTISAFARMTSPSLGATSGEMPSSAYDPHSGNAPVCWSAIYAMITGGNGSLQVDSLPAALPRLSEGRITRDYGRYAILAISRISRRRAARPRQQRSAPD